MTGSAFDLEEGWALHPHVALREEPFGALAYHFDTRRLSFLKSRRLMSVVASLQAHPTATAACQAAGITEAELPKYEGALAVLAEKGMIVLREQSA